METQNRSSYPDSPHPDHGHSSDWISKPYSIGFTAVGFFVLIFGIAVFLGYRQIDSTRHNALTTDKTTANLLATLILEHNKATIGILQSYAHRPLFIAAVKNKDVAKSHRHLFDLKKYADIDLTFVTDKRGILWLNFPVFPEAIGKDLSSREWYKGISSNWKPYISTVFKLIVGDKPLAVAVCVPISDEKEGVIGILASSQRLGFLVDTIEGVPFSPFTTVNVIDRAGKILYSNKVPYQENITDYRFFPFLEAAVKGKKQQIEINDPQKGQEKRYLTVVTIGEIGWTIVIERSRGDIYRSEFRRFIEIGAISFLLFLLIIFFLVYLRKVSLFKKAEELLQAETKLRQGDEKLRALSSRQEAILAAVPAIIMEVDNNKVYTWANSAGIKFFGREVIGKEASFYFEGEQDTYDTVKPLFNGAEGIIYVESWQRRQDGEKRLLAWWCRVLKDKKGNVEGVLSSAYDITDLKQAEEALGRSEQLLKDTQAISKVGGWEYDVEKKLLIWTDEVYRIYGLERSYDPNNIGKAISFYYEEDQQIIEKAFQKAMQIGKPYDLELQFNAADGTKKWVRTMGNPVLKDDKIIKVFGNIIDITERKQAEVALKSSLSLLSASLESTADGILIVDREGKIARWNEKFADMWKIPRDVLSSRNDEKTINHILSQLADPEQFVAKVRKLYEQPEESSFDQIEFADGRVFERYSQPQRIEETIVGRVWSFRDITSRKRAEEGLRESEEKFRTMVETFPLAIYLSVGIEQIAEYLNPAFIKLFGYTLAEIPTVDQWWPLAYPDETYRREISEEWTRKIKRAIETQSPIEPMEVVVTCKDGSKKNISWGYISIGDKNYAYGLDLTDRMQAEVEIHRLNTELEQRVIERTIQLEAANKEMEAFSYSVSHDLRAPLRGIDGWSLALLEDYGESLDDQARKYLSRVRTETQLMGILIDDMLKLSRVNRAELQLKPIDLTAMAHRIVNRLQADQPPGPIEFIIQPGLRAIGDSPLLDIALTNLFGNAFKFSGTRSLVRIEFGEAEVDGGKAFFVRDNGVGFDMAYAPKLFGAFQRLHKSSDFPGTGIGLATVQRIIHRHGGRVWAHAQPDQGATFYFTLEETL